MRLRISMMILVMLSGALALQCGKAAFPEKLEISSPWHFTYDSSEVGITRQWYSDEDLYTSWPTVPSGNYWESTYDGRGWYIQSVTLPELNSDRKLALVITSVDDNAKVWVNDSLVMDHVGYGEKFFADVTQVIRPGRENRIAIIVDDFGGPGGLNGKVFIQKYLDEIDLVKGKYYDATSIQSPDWVTSAKIYEIFVRQFSESGDFAGVVNRLDALQALGVNTLWLMPVHPVGNKHRKGKLGSPYSVRDYYGVNPNFGTKEDFQELVQEVHERGMRLILGMVLNHSSWDNPLINDHPDWYTQNEAGEIITPNDDWTDVADFNYDNPELRQYMIDMLKYWVDDMQVDGFRFDVAELVPLDFWIDAREAVNEVKPDVLFLAEGSAPELHVTAFDMSYSWNIYCGLITMLQENKEADTLEDVYLRERYKYPRDAIRMRFTGNHDEQRPMKLLTKPQVLAASVYAHTIPGVPMIYNGQEVGLTEKPSLFERDPLEWERGDSDFRTHYQRLFSLREKHTAIIHGEYKLLEGQPESAIVPFLRKSDSETLLVLINFSDAAVEFSVQTPNQYFGLKEIYTNKMNVVLSHSITGEVAPYGWGVYRLHNNKR